MNQSILSCYLSFNIVYSNMTKPIKKVAIIGAGPTGLAQLKNLLEVSKSSKAKCELQVKIFESKPDVGGVWYVSQFNLHLVSNSRYSTGEEKHYRKAVIQDVKGKGKEKMYIYPPGEVEPSPMYEGLRTNLPHVSHSITSHLGVQYQRHMEGRADE
jgi:cation diffusion facilitator CzcD-associated flavoprotein CzcO